MPESPIPVSAVPIAGIGIEGEDTPPWNGVGVGCEGTPPETGSDVEPAVLVGAIEHVEPPGHIVTVSVVKTVVVLNVAGAVPNPEELQVPTLSVLVVVLCFTAASTALPPVVVIPVMLL